MNNKGFTLLEMVIAIAIFAVISVVSYGSLTRFLDVTEDLDQRQERFKDVKLTFAALGRDLRFASTRIVRDEYGDAQGAFLSAVDQPPAPGEFLRLTTAAPDSTLNVIGVQRVAWRLDGDRLYRIRWRVVDGATPELELRQRLLTGVQDISIRFIQYSKQTGVTADDSWSGVSAPPGVEILLAVRGTTYRRVFEVHDGA